MKIAVVATLLCGNFHANPYGPELQVKQMLELHILKEYKMKRTILLISVILLFASCTSLRISKDNQDLEYLVSAINDNYPFLQVHLRRDGFDWNKYILGLNKNSVSCSNKIEIFSKYLYGLNGHVHFLTNDQFPYYYDLYQDNLAEYPELLPWCSILNDTKVKKAYNFDNNIQPTNQTFGFANSKDFI